jgi:O-antigen/teichoic acid export membrane protein
MIRRRSIVWNTGLSLALNITARATGTIAFILISRKGLLAEAGVFSLALGYLAILTTLFIGLDDLLVRESARSPESSDSWMVAYSLIRGLGSLVCGLLLWSALGLLRLYTVDEQWVMGIILLSLLLEAVVATTQAVLYAQQRFGWPLVTTLVGAAVRLGWVVGALWAEQDLMVLAWAWPLGSLAMVVMALLPFWRSWPKLVRARVDPKAVSQMVRALPSFSGISFLSALEYQLDVILLSVLLTRVEVAVYSAAATLMAVVLTFAQAYRMVIYPALVRAFTHQPAAVSRLVRYSIGWMIGLAGLAAGVVFLSAPVLIRIIYGGRLTLAEPILRVLIWNVLLAFVNVPLVRFLMASNGQTLVWQFLVVSVILNVGANLVLIPALGVVAPAYARLLSSSVFCGLAGWATWRRLPRPASELSL